MASAPGGVSSNVGVRVRQQTAAPTDLSSLQAAWASRDAIVTSGDVDLGDSALLVLLVCWMKMGICVLL